MPWVDVGFHTDALSPRWTAFAGLRPDKNRRLPFSLHRLIRNNEFNVISPAEW